MDEGVDVLVEPLSVLMSELAELREGELAAYLKDSTLRLERPKRQWRNVTRLRLPGETG